MSDPGQQPPTAHGLLASFADVQHMGLLPAVPTAGAAGATVGTDAVVSTAGCEVDRVVAATAGATVATGPSAAAAVVCGMLGTTTGATVGAPGKTPPPGNGCWPAKAGVAAAPGGLGSGVSTIAVAGKSLTLFDCGPYVLPISPTMMLVYLTWDMGYLFRMMFGSPALGEQGPRLTPGFVRGYLSG
mmetsp:Transcript_81766/g.189935  ORF Transcript_81766/g.189935 Transcript_81766/m.189935 type:complete len:186 (-) Transcript_81766:1059-1616(-)